MQTHANTCLYTHKYKHIRVNAHTFIFNALYAIFTYLLTDLLVRLWGKHTNTYRYTNTITYPWIRKHANPNNDTNPQTERTHKHTHPTQTHQHTSKPSHSQTHNRTQTHDRTKTYRHASTCTNTSASTCTNAPKHTNTHRPTN